ncbi:unnamed protein product [Pleuronectes platessa]|uniref:Uncharacterized protein n=1 Tax=Pleuronectes platessa TaxID=8262 RepID=A0A9N7TL67_PLEPL|nr:unnamed protein product [Pleuronectes platessa]
MDYGNVSGRIETSSINTREKMDLACAEASDGAFPLRSDWSSLRAGLHRSEVLRDVLLQHTSVKEERGSFNNFKSLHSPMQIGGVMESPLDMPLDYCLELRTSL